jgi:cell division protein FtsW (lipid II flippase)
VSSAAGVFVRLGPAWITILASLALSMIGIYAIDVASGVGAAFGDAGTQAPTLGPIATRQALYAAVGILAGIAMLFPSYRVLGYFSWALLLLSIVLMIFLLIPGVPASIVRPRNGARSWIDLGPMDLQPSELAKIAWVLTLGWYLRFRANHRTLVGLLPPGILTAIPVGLIVLQPDLGTALLFIPALFAILVAAGAKLRHLTIIVLLAMLAAPLAYPVLRPHQRERIVGLFMQVRGDTSQDQDINMQQVTAQRLIGAGGLMGLPEPHSRALLQYNALPERHNDMIFAVLCNRFGMVGGVGVLVLYLVWALGALWTAGRSPEPVGRIIPVGFVGFVLAQVVVNAGMNLGLLPVIGITLPFVSSGGSSMLAMWIMTGLVASVAIRRPRAGTVRKNFEYDDDE